MTVVFFILIGLAVVAMIWMITRIYALERVLAEEELVFRIIAIAYPEYVGFRMETKQLLYKNYPTKEIVQRLRLNKRR